MSFTRLAGLSRMGTHDWRLTIPPHDDQPPCFGGGHEPPLPPGAAVVALRPELTRADIPGLCEQLLALFRDSDADSDADSALVLCDVGAITDPDAVIIEALACLQLAARRHGRRIRLLRAGPQLGELLALTGLNEVLPLYHGTGPEPP